MHASQNLDEIESTTMTSTSKKSSPPHNSRPTSLKLATDDDEIRLPVISGPQESGLKNRATTTTSSTKTPPSLISSESATSHGQIKPKTRRVKLKTATFEDFHSNFTPALTNTSNSSDVGSKSSKLISSIPNGNGVGGLPLDVDANLAAELDLLYVPKNCAEQVELFAKYVWESGWKAMPHHALPHWLRDNDFLLKGHRPPLPSVKACFKSMFRIHTETGNIWTHLIGSISFIAIAVYFLSRPSVEIQVQEKFVFGAFFLGAIICLVCSTLFHTFCCFSPRVSKLFNKIDYCGISVLTMGSFVPWLYYAFYCEPIPKIVYLILIAILGFACIVVSLWDKFSEPQFRAIRAGMFIALGLSGLIPALHYILTVGGQKAFNVGALGWLVFMAVLYIVGACLYAARIPERLFPGRFDIWFQSHQIFHVFVVAAAYVHYHGITKLASYRLTMGDCLTAHTESDYSFEF